MADSGCMSVNKGLAPRGSRETDCGGGWEVGGGREGAGSAAGDGERPCVGLRPEAFAPENEQDRRTGSSVAALSFTAALQAVERDGQAGRRRARRPVRALFLGAVPEKGRATSPHPRPHPELGGASLS